MGALMTKKVTKKAVKKRPAKKKKSKKTQLEFIGYDLGHGETALGRAYGATVREPEILEWLSLIHI